MNAMLEKLKALDKKVWIGVGIGAVVLVALIVTLVLVLGGSSGDGENGPTGAGVATTTSTSRASTTAKSTSTTKTTASTTATTTATSQTTVATTAPTQDNTPTPDNNTPQQNTPTPDTTPTPDNTPQPTAPQGGAVNTPAPTQPTVVKPNGEEILGAGSKDQPYLETPVEEGNAMVMTTISIPAGKSVYYSIYRVGGMLLTIDNPNAYVVHEGQKYTAHNGTVTVTVADALASDAVLFEIGNNGSVATGFTLRFASQAGSYMNPVNISNITASNNVKLPEGHENGYYYKYRAEKSGVIRFYMNASVDSGLSATNKRDSAQRTLTTNAQNYSEDVKIDAQGNAYIELAVQAGDEIIITVNAEPNRRNKYPATEITWHGMYA